MARSQSPFKLTQSRRIKLGRGYSGWTLVGETSLAQRVMIGASLGAHSCGGSATALMAKSEKHRVETKETPFKVVRGQSLTYSKGRIDPAEYTFNRAPGRG